MTGTAAADPAAFVRANTALGAPLLVPEIRLYQASEITPIWEATERTLVETGLPPPFWAFAWAGGQALARYVLDHPETVAGRRVLDFASGSGIAAIAAARARAAAVTASEIDPFAAAAIGLNAAANRVALDIACADLVGARGPWDVVLAGDVCYEQAMAGRVAAWLAALAAEGTDVLLGDPIRGYLPRRGLQRVIAYCVRTTRELEDTDLRNAVVWRVLPG